MEDIKVLQERSGLRSEVFARALGISMDTLSSYRSGRLKTPAWAICRANDIAWRIRDIVEERFDKKKLDQPKG